MSKSIYDKLNLINQETDKIKTMLVNSKQLTAEEATLENLPPAIQAIIEAGGGSVEANPYETLYMQRTNNATNMAGLFAYYSLSELDLSDFDTSKATNMNYMFRDCTNLTSLDLNNLNTSNVKSMYYMFYYCSSLTSLDLSGFDTSNVTNMGYMFSNCTKLISLDLSNWNTNKVTDMGYMFNYCTNLTSLDLSNLNTSNVTNIGGMFSYCKALISLNVSSFDTSKITSLIYTFQNCENLTSLDLSNWDVSECTTPSACSNAFYGCKALTDFKAPKNISTAMSFSTCTNLTHDSLMSIINNLATVTSTKKLTLGATNLAKLTNEEKAVATNKGWTLA